jgi:MFS transporter, putative metabolite:H+ symporter
VRRRGIPRSDDGRWTFALTLLIYGVATGAAALSWSAGALLAFRFVTGLGPGAEPP